MSAANRRRGARAEVAVVNYLKANGYPDARRYLAGDGRQPGDVDFHPLVCLEVKDRAESSWPSWCRQAASEARAGMVPVVVRRTRGVTDVGLWGCRVQWFGWWKATGTAAAAAWPRGRTVEVLDGAMTDDGRDVWPWTATTLSEFVAALRRFDVLDGAA